MTQTDDARGPEFPADWRDRAHSFKGMFKLQAAWADGFNAARDQIRADLATQPDPLADPRVVALVEALRDIEGRSRPFNPTGNPKWINDHARAALAAFDTTGGKDE